MLHYASMNAITTLFSIAILIISVIFHELAHGAAADYLGDPTPRLSGRLTLNPLAHADMVGSVILPILCVISGSGLLIGWAKPVPFNPKYFTHPRRDQALVAAAGPIMNMVIVGIAAAAFHAAAAQEMTALAQILSVVVVANLSLAIFNLIPIPPLDGHHLLGAAIPAYRTWSDRVMAGYGLMILILFIFLAGSFIGPVISFFARLILGL